MCLCVCACRLYTFFCVNNFINLINLRRYFLTLVASHPKCRVEQRPPHSRFVYFLPFNRFINRKKKEMDLRYIHRGIRILDQQCQSLSPLQYCSSSEERARAMHKASPQCLLLAYFNKYLIRARLGHGGSVWWFVVGEGGEQGGIICRQQTVIPISGN